MYTAPLSFQPIFELMILGMASTLNKRYHISGRSVTKTRIQDHLMSVRTASHFWSADGLSEMVHNIEALLTRYGGN